MVTLAAWRGWEPWQVSLHVIVWRVGGPVGEAWGGTYRYAVGRCWPVLYMTLYRLSLPRPRPSRATDIEEMEGRVKDWCLFGLEIRVRIPAVVTHDPPYHLLYISIFRVDMPQAIHVF